MVPTVVVGRSFLICESNAVVGRDEVADALVVEAVHVLLRDVDRNVLLLIQKGSQRLQSLA